MKTRWAQLMVAISMWVALVPAVLSAEADLEEPSDAVSAVTEFQPAVEPQMQVEDDTADQGEPSRSDVVGQLEQSRSGGRTPRSNERRVRTNQGDSRGAPQDWRSPNRGAQDRRTQDRANQQDGAARSNSGRRPARSRRADSTDRHPPVSRSAGSDTNSIGNLPKYDGFRIIAERNIFNPNRSPRLSGGEPREKRTTPAELVTFVGALSYEKGSYAFFDGSRPQLRKAIEVGQMIAGHKLVGIGKDTIALQWKTNTFQLRIGGQLRQTEEGWKVVAGMVTPAAKEAESEAKSLEVAEDDVVKRLMKEREQELKNGE